MFITFVTERLVQGDSTDQILEDIRQSVDSNLRRVHLTTWKDVQNIRQSYGIGGSGTSGIQVRHRSNGVRSLFVSRFFCDLSIFLLRD